MAWNMLDSGGNGYDERVDIRPARQFKFIRKGGEKKMELLKRLILDEEGQGLVEYTLIVLLVVLVFWVAVRETNVGDELANAWGQVINCLSDPLNCS